MNSTEIYFNLNPVNFFIISGLLQNFIISVILFFRQGERRLANRFLAINICIVNIHLTYLMVLDTNLENMFPYLLWIPYSFLAAIGPFILFYVKALTNADFSISRINSKHLIPVLIEVGIQVTMISQSILNRELLYNTPLYFYTTPLIYIWVASSIFYYLRLSLGIIDNHEVWLIRNLSNLKEITLTWLKRLIVYYRLLWIVWIPFVTAFLLFFRYQLQYLVVVLVLYFLMLVMIYLTFWIGIEGLSRTNFILIRDSEKKTENKNFTQLTQDEIHDYIRRLDQLMSEEKIYLNQNLSLYELAARLKADPNLISFILNNHLKMNFYDFINRHRIDEVKSKLDDAQYNHLTLLGIALESGFNSKTTFNRVFKRITGITPTQFKKKNTNK